MQNFTRVVNDEGRTFTVRVVRRGDRYGRDMAIVHDDDEALVEFYDRTYPFTTDPDGVVMGQFVGRYRFTTLISHTGGLRLDGGEKAWSLDVLAFAAAKRYLRAYTSTFQINGRGECRSCGRHYHDLAGSDRCPSDDCPSWDRQVTHTGSMVRH